MQHTSSQPEQWRDIRGHEGHYQVSDRGRVRSLDRVVVMKNGRKKTLKGVIRKAQTMPNGYLKLNLGKDGKLLNRYVHRLVLEAFVGPCPEGMETCHNNGVPSDNRLENLRWDTVAENNRDIIEHGTHPHHGKSHCVRGHKFTPENTRTNERGHRWCRQCERARSWKKSDEELYSGSCKRGHAFTRANTRVKANGQRCCRECSRISDKSRVRKATR